MCISFVLTVLAWIALNALEDLVSTVLMYINTILNKI